MKGIVFSEFNEMVEERFSIETADRIIIQSALASGGAYTAVGSYEHAELLALIDSLSAETGIPAGELTRTFGAHLAARFSALYPTFFEGVDNTFDFLETIDQHVHVEVQKLYPDAELPTFHTNRSGPAVLQMIYESRRPFADLAEGLIEGCASHFGERIGIGRHDTHDEQLHRTTFTLTLLEA